MKSQVATGTVPLILAVAKQAKRRVVTQVTAGPNRVLLREVVPLIFQRIVIVFSTVLDVDITAIRARC